MNSISPQVGQWYLTRGGDIMLTVLDKKNINTDYDGTYPILTVDRSGADYSYTSVGSYRDDGFEDDYDLVEHLPDCTGFDYVNPTAKVLERVPIKLWIDLKKNHIYMFNSLYTPDPVLEVTEVKLDELGFYYEK